LRRPYRRISVAPGSEARISLGASSLTFLKDLAFPPLENNTCLLAIRAGTAVLLCRSE
jgi:hypothetical protein